MILYTSFNPLPHEDARETREGGVIWGESNESHYLFLAHCERLRSVGGDKDALSVLEAMEDLENPGRWRPRRINSIEANLLATIKRHKAGVVDRRCGMVLHYF